MRIDPDTDEIFTDAPRTGDLARFLETLVRVRRDLYVDPMLADPWSCDPDRCRPLLGPNLCCKVQVRCVHLVGGRCAVHGDKPFDCALFPLDLVRIGGVRVVTTVKNMDFFSTPWCRYDRDMLRCFDSSEAGGQSMFAAQRPVLERVFTRSEMVLMARALEAHRP